MAWQSRWRQYLEEKWQRLNEVMVTRLQDAGDTVKRKALLAIAAAAAWFRSAWQAIRGEMLRTWQNLKPLRLPEGWQARVLLGLFILIILIPGINYYIGRPALPPPATKPLPVAVRADETNLLARLVAAEAEDEPYAGQVAVVAVVLNRLRDPAFPKTIPDIIFEPWAFESVANGHYWEVQVRPRDYAATRDALNDWDPSNGALYFFNPATATSAWIWTRPQITQIGNHIFTR
ncbi:Cell wall hydrolase, SleB [Moorella glycerini]|uniref:Spore cortex-lytic enzyme n=1 Tax=Neomoorella stamsii TaxID=1266720 RepID=A0A9X7J3K9_9FIRM|nr:MULTISPECIES: cell wall hydrolase [Moorella]PRR72345.1 Spore cortex-lytic enzyme precursor [Moorella stamsii]CEP68844.1 Cell wall hydrolase, SleB [Moorella glycerini]